MGDVTPRDKAPYVDADSWPAYNAQRERADHAEAEAERLREAIREHVDTVMPRDGSLISHAAIASACERLWREAFDA